MTTTTSTTTPAYGRNSFVPPPEPPPLRIAVWVGSKQKLVTGLIRSTSCDDVVQALVHQEQLPAHDQWMLYEAWGKEERPLRGRAKIAKVLRSWGEDLPYVKFSLRRRGGATSSAAASRDRQGGMGGARSVSNPSLPTAHQEVPTQPRSVSNSTLPRMHHQQNPAFRSSSLDRSCSSNSSSTSSARSNTSHSSNTSATSEADLSRRSANQEAISKLMRLMEEQDRQLKEQMARIQEVEQQIEEHETNLHMSRIQEDGVNYIQAGYLIPSDDGSSGSSGSSSGSGDETVIEVDEDVPEAEEFVTICEDVSRVEEQLVTEKDRIKSLSQLISEASQGVTGWTGDSSSSSQEASNLSRQQQEADSQEPLGDMVQQEIKHIKEAMQNSIYVSMSQEEQIYKMNQALSDMHQQLQGKEAHLNNLLRELEDPQADNGGDNEDESELDTTTCQDNHAVSTTAPTANHNTTEYSMLRSNPLGGDGGLVNDILLRYKHNLEQIQRAAVIQEDSTQVNNTSINNTSSSSDDSHDSGISGSDPENQEKDSDSASSSSNSPEKLPSPPPAAVQASRLSMPSLSLHSSAPHSDLSHSQHLSQISVICQNSTTISNNETLPNDTLQPLEVLVDKETVLTSTPVQVQDMGPSVLGLSKPGAVSRGLLDQVRLNAHLARAAATNQTDDGKRGQEQLEVVQEEQDDESPADDTYAMLCVGQRSRQRQREESDEEEEEEEGGDDEGNNTFKMALKSPMPARKRVAFAERDSIREITMYSMNNTTMIEDVEQESTVDNSNITQDITNSSGDIRCWGMACSSSKKKASSSSSSHHRQSQPQPPPRLPPRQQPSQPQPDRFLVTLHPHTTLALAQQTPGSQPPTPLVHHHQQQTRPHPLYTSSAAPSTVKSHSVTASHNRQPPAEDRQLENESYRLALYNFSPANESYNNYLSSNDRRLSGLGASKETKAPAKTRLFKLSSSSATAEASRKESKKVPFVKRFKMPWHSERKSNKEVKIEVVGEKSINQSVFHDTFNDSYRHALTVKVGTEVNSKPSVGQGEESSRLTGQLQRGVVKDNDGNTQGGIANTPHAKTDSRASRPLRHSFSEGHIRRNSAPDIDTNIPSDVAQPQGSQSARTTPRKPATPRRVVSTPGTPKTPRNETFNKSGLGYTPLGRSYTMPDIGKIGYSWIYQYDYENEADCSAELDTTLMESDCRQNAEQCSPGSNSAGYGSEPENPSVPANGRDMVPYCTYSSYDNDGNYAGSGKQVPQEDCNSDTGLSSMHSDDVPVLETLV